MKTIEQQAIFAIIATVIFSFIYFLYLDWMKKRSSVGNDNLLRWLFLARKTVGLLLFGLIPGVIAGMIYRTDPLKAGLTWSLTSETWIWILASASFFILLNLLNSRKEDIYSMYPEMRLIRWGPGDILLSGSGWAVYLVGYEYLFRGLLLFTCYDAFGLWPAVVINLALYSSLHLPKGMKEAIAAIPFGALLCYLTIESHSILPAVIIHTVQAVSCEMLCIWRNPEMKFNFKKNR